MTDAWAVKDYYGINVKTVSDTRRAAIVNWLVTVPKIMIYNHMTDAEIESLWRNRPLQAEVIKVSISETESELSQKEVQS